MKKITIIVFAMMMGLNANAQLGEITNFFTVAPAIVRNADAHKGGGAHFSLGDVKVSLGISAYSTNYWLSSIGAGFGNLVNGLLDPDGEHSYLNMQYAFSLPVANSVPEGYAPGRMKSPYRRTFSHPFHRFGDLGAGLTCAFDFGDFPVGVYGGVKYKTSEVAYNNLPKGSDNDRAHYVAPELGLRFRIASIFLLELGAQYDAVVGYKGHTNNFDKEAVKSGFNAVGAIGIQAGGYSLALNYYHPLHNFYDQDFTPDNGITFPFHDVKRKVGYFMFTTRFPLN